MQGLFCPKCKSLMPPGTQRCRVCGNAMDQSCMSTQSCLGCTAPAKKRADPRIVENAEAPFLPYEPRANQLDIISDIRNALDEGRHIIVESGTGTGKTITSLAASLEHAERKGKVIVYLTRTISQSDQVMRELRAISKIHPVTGVAITGRNKSCPLFRGTSGFEGLSPSVLSMMCDERHQKSLRGQPGGCRYFERVPDMETAVRAYCASNMPTSEDLDKHCESLGCCPYEMKKLLMKGADVVAAPYIHVLSDDIRNNLMGNLGIAENPHALLLIVDEAHNFIDAARDQESFCITMKLVENALDECDTMRSPVVFEDIPLKQFVLFLKNSIRALATEKLGLNQTEAVIDGDLLEDRIMDKFRMSRTDLQSAIETMIDLGDARTELLMDKGENRESEILEVGRLMKRWCSAGGGRFVRSIKTDSDGEYLNAACIDPDDVSRFLNSLDGSVHMSGTLKPLAQYARVLGLERNPRFREYPSPFP